MIINLLEVFNAVKILFHLIYLQRISNLNIYFTILFLIEYHILSPEW
jgi:hypothetical protein